MQFKPSEKVKVSANSSSFIMMHRDEVAHYIERLEIEMERREREAYERKILERLHKKMDKQNTDECQTKKEPDIFYFEDIY